MKVKVCSYSRSIETMYGYGLKQWHKVGMEAELEEKEVPGDAFNQLKQLVDNSLNNVLPPEEPTGTIVRDVPYFNEKDEELEKVILHLQSLEHKEDAEQYLIESGYRYNLQALGIVNSKPSKNK